MNRLSHRFLLVVALGLSLTVSCARTEKVESDSETSVSENPIVKVESDEKDSNVRAIYVDGFASILGDDAAEKKLLEYAAAHEMDELLLYELHKVIDKSNATDLNHTNALASFISRAKADYGVKRIAATGESGGFFNDVVDPYNNSRIDSNEKFDIYNLEFEFWNSESIKGVYADSYLVPAGLSSDENGALEFFISSLKEMRALAEANSHDVSVEAYIGWTHVASDRSQEEVEELIASHVDHLRLHAYRKKPDFEYTAKRLEGLAKSTRGEALKVSILFSGEEEFMQGWLQEKSMNEAEIEFRRQFNEEASKQIKDGIHLQGFTYYNYHHNIAVPAK